MLCWLICIVCGSLFPHRIKGKGNCDFLSHNSYIFLGILSLYLNSDFVSKNSEKKSQNFDI